ncbi:transglycosylase domain-containing protein [Bacillus kwashiorkori]|uniref:transglycosylase domain-containing protein n=1 Tax=Bacillus kwashiorkori TaxID=1522318 RepID=UPI0007817D5A|nr:PBP1A family penicillin-binding protein [Bacillus kwashiorkori]
MELKTNPHFLRTLRLVKGATFVGACFVIIAFFLILSAYTIAKIAGPPPLTVPQSTIYFASDGSIIGETHSGQKRYWVPLDDIAPELMDATITVEDQHFYTHLGFDLKRIGGAIFANVKALGKAQGASTISQQYARNLFLSHEKTWKRKLKEALYTIRLEANYTKEEILEGYLNTIYYGHGAYGVEAASRFYFNKSAKDLSLSEAALLAGIPKGPSRFSPFVSLEKAKQRQALILQLMEKKDIITEQQRKSALTEEINLFGNDHVKKVEFAPYFQDVVRFHLKNDLGIDEKTINLGGLRIYTTLDREKQEVAEKTIQSLISTESDIQVGLVAINPKNGYVEALVGGRDYQKSSFNRAIQAIRQPGSTMKPILYYAALEHGFTPSTTLRSEETIFTYDDGRKEYTPQNYNHQYPNDEITLAQAIAVSDNIYAVKTHLFLGMDTLVEYAKKFGIQSKQKKVPSLALGTSGVSVLEMAKAYSLFANNGEAVDPVFIERIENIHGEVIYEHKSRQEQILDPRHAFVMSHMLTGVFDERFNGYATVTGNSIAKKMTREYAGKSGTTDTDSWMIGYSPEIVTAVWTGYDKGKKITMVTEKSYAKNIWIDFMETSLKDKPLQPFQPPNGVVGVEVDAKNGLLATETCPTARLTYFVAGTEPTDYCLDHIPPIEKQEKEKEQQEKKPWFKRLFDWLN